MGLGEKVVQFPERFSRPFWLVCVSVSELVQFLLHRACSHCSPVCGVQVLGRSQTGMGNAVLEAAAQGLLDLYPQVA